MAVEDTAPLRRIFEIAREELAAQGQPLPLPPDPEDEVLDRAFWALVDERIHREGGAWPQAPS